MVYTAFLDVVDVARSLLWFTAITELSCFSSGNCILLTERSLVGIQVQPHRPLSGRRLKIRPIGHAPSGARSPGGNPWTPWAFSFDVGNEIELPFLGPLHVLAVVKLGVEDDSEGVAACHRPRCACTTLPARRS